MLLGLVTGNFQPHTKSIEEGPALQLEILCALEKVQKESMDAVNTGSGECDIIFTTLSTFLLRASRKTEAFSAGTIGWQEEDED